MTHSRIALACLLLFTTFGAFAQETRFLGVNLVLESATDSYNPTLGINYEQRLAKGSGIEAGVLYRSYGMEVGSFISQSSEYFSRLKESHLSIPVSYKIYTRFVNISAGPSIDLYIGWRDESDKPSVRITEYSGMTTFNIGVIGKVRKNFKVSKQLYVEPEVRLNPYLTRERTYIGFGFAGKYKL